MEQLENYQLKYIEEKLDAHEERIKGLERLSNEFTKISTILEMQTRMNEKQDETLTKINDNLTNLNHTTQQLGQRVQSLEGQVKDVTQQDHISMIDLTKKIMWSLFTLGIGGLITWLFTIIH